MTINTLDFTIHKIKGLCRGARTTLKDHGLKRLSESIREAAEYSHEMINRYGQEKGELQDKILSYALDAQIDAHSSTSVLLRYQGYEKQADWHFNLACDLERTRKEYSNDD